MASIVYNGHDFSEYCTAEVIEPGAHAVEVQTADIPGLAGLFVQWVDLRPLNITLRLHLALDSSKTDRELMVIRRTLRGWLYCLSGGVLVLPDELGLELHDAVCTKSGNWDKLFEDGYVDVTFTCYDPVAFGDSVSVVNETTFEVAGTWKTAPRFTLTPTAGATSVDLSANGGEIHLLHDFTGEETVVIDCGTLKASIDGEDFSMYITVPSTFFVLEPGENTIELANVADFTCEYTERWV